MYSIGLRIELDTYPALLHIRNHLRRQRPRSPRRLTLGSALDPDIVVLVAVAGAAVPVAAGVVGHIGDRRGLA